MDAESQFTELQTQHQINALAAISDYLKKAQDHFREKKLDGELSGVPEGLKRARLDLMDILIEDLENVFAALYSDTPAQAPMDVYEHILSIRDQEPVSAQGAKARFFEKVDAFKRRGGELETPDFLSVLGLKGIAPDDLEDFAAEFSSTIHIVANYYQSDIELRAHHHAELIDDTAEAFVNQHLASATVEEQKQEKPPEQKKSRGDAWREKFTKRHKVLPEGVAEELQGHLQTVDGGSASERAKSEEWLRFAIELPFAKSGTSSGELSPEAQVEQVQNMKAALDGSHAGDHKIKRQLLEHMAGQFQRAKANGKVICLVGPPGVGKTTLGKSIAKATERKFASISLGGERDAAKIKGHGFTYTNSRPGAVLKAVQRAGTTQMVIMLDEIGRMSKRDGEDPEGTLLELLDPEQNKNFYDNYLGVSVDLSDVLFLCTANDISHMSQAVKDRMHIIRHDGYIPEEKMEIAINHLVPKLQEETKLYDNALSFTDEAILKLIKNYTQEAGVRMLERRLEGIFNKVLLSRMECAQEIAEHGGQTEITADNVDDYCEPEHQVHHTCVLNEDLVGRFNALAVSDAGGSVNRKQAERFPSRDGFKLVDPTGQLGPIAKETIQVASTWVRKNAARLGISPKLLDKTELRIHSDSWQGLEGPSAGGVVTTLIVSAMTNIPTRRDVAMTGTINYDGQIGKIGGLKQKLDGARTAGVATVMISRENEADLADVPQSLKDDLNIIVVDTMDDVLKHALVRQPKPLDMSLTGRLVRGFDDISGRLRKSNDNAPSNGGTDVSRNAHDYSGMAP